MGCPLAAVVRAGALAGLVLGAGVACGGVEPPPPAAPTPSATVSFSGDVRANTAAICGRLANINFVRRRAFGAHWDKLLKALQDGDEAAGAAAGEGAKRELKTWAAELDKVAADTADPSLRTTVIRGATILIQLASDDDRTPADQVLPKVGEVENQLAVCCPDA